MDTNLALALVLLLSSSASAAVHIDIAAGPFPADAINRTEAVAARLMEAPLPRAREGGLSITAAAWKKNIEAAERNRQILALRALWGARLTVREDAAVSSVSSAVVPPASLKSRARVEVMRARLAEMPRPLEEAAQNRFYDGSQATHNSAVSGGAVSSLPAKTAARALAPMKLKDTPPPPAPPAATPISWKRAGIEVLKGAGHTIAAVFTWKGLAVAAASIALVTVAPVAIYGLLALGAAFGGWTIGKALVNGTTAYKANDAEGFYGASREMGRGVLALGMTLMGARHSPTNLRPHFPKTSGEWRAMAAAVDDEPIVAMSILRGRNEKH